MSPQGDVAASRKAKRRRRKTTTTTGTTSSTATPKPFATQANGSHSLLLRNMLPIGRPGRPCQGGRRGRGSRCRCRCRCREPSLRTCKSRRSIWLQFNWIPFIWCIHSASSSSSGSLGPTFAFGRQMKAQAVVSTQWALLPRSQMTPTDPASNLEPT